MVMSKVTSLFRSRRFYAAVLGVAITACGKSVGIGPAGGRQIAALLIAWIVGDSIKKTE